MEYIKGLNEYVKNEKYRKALNLPNEQEEEYITKDALKQILYINEYHTILKCDDFQEYIDSKNTEIMLEPLDYRNILDYLEYHRGINQETIDEFYEIFMPYLEKLMKMKNYRKFIDSVNLLLDKILYEYVYFNIVFPIFSFFTKLT